MSCTCFLRDELQDLHDELHINVCPGLSYTRYLVPGRRYTRYTYLLLLLLLSLLLLLLFSH